MAGVVKSRTLETAILTRQRSVLATAGYEASLVVFLVVPAAMRVPKSFTQRSSARPGFR
jgi:hypothetical protein